MIKLAIFDLDGTLIDAYTAIGKSVNFVLKKFGCPARKNSVIKRAVGWGDENLLKPFVRPPDLQAALAAYRGHHSKSLVKYSRLLPCALNVLKRLDNSGYKIAVASNRPTRFSKILLKHLKIDKYFDYVLCADRVKRLKPHPQILNAIMRRLKVGKAHTIYVGDMFIDVQAGRRAGVTTVAVLGGSSSKAELKREHPDFILKNVCGLIPILKNR
ncbi:MAG: HAD family hydrolase [Candidatus Omnitrophica bacterium]|nr:HAD family hydrolase [Candidatus Omnitrophota bacterium]